ncbi:MAG TPA: rhodanese-like domain-containing protein [Chitinophagaceae bacterium]|nr:rhodanese-like domain-containing protein [Chitinophagaceae bacterium]
MKKTFTVLLIGAAVAILFYSFSKDSRSKKAEPAIKYTCLPCGSACDSMIYDKAGTCSHCNMALVDKSSIVHKNIQPGKMCSLDEKNVVFLDVRTPAEFNGTAENKFGAIKNAINIPVQELEKRMNELEKYKDKEIVVYCSHSHRSPRASYMLTQNGFKRVTNMLGGMSVWKDLVKKNDCNERLYQQQ